MLDKMPKEEPRSELTTENKILIIVVELGLLYLFFQVLVGVIKALTNGELIT